MKLNLAMLAVLLSILGIAWHASAKLTRVETALEAVPELRVELKQLREDVIVLKSHLRSWEDENRR